MLGPLHRAAVEGDPEAGSCRDHSREALGLAALTKLGFTEEFVADDAGLRVSGTGRRYRVEDVRIRDYYRFEGTSDPDDMSVIYALETSDGTRGTLVDAFGSYASPVVGALVDRMRVDPPARPTRAA